MLDFLNRTTEYLEKLTEANRNLLKALREYQAVLVSGKPEEVEKATNLVDRLTSAVRILDEERRIFVDRFFVSRGWNGPRNFSAISERVKESGVNDDEAAAFDRAARARMGLIEVLAETDAQNSLNLTLIGQSMNFAEVSIRALFGCNDEPTVYGPDKGEEHGPSILDAQA